MTTKWPYHSTEEIEKVKDVLLSGKTNYWTGNECREFEKEFAEYVGTQYAVALMNGTVALEAALYALNIGVGDEVITTTRTFIASAAAVVARGAKPVLADVDRVSQNITAQSIEPLINEHTKAIIVVHLAGWPCDMDPIIALAQKFNLKIIEDCAQAHGAVYKGRKVGSLGDVAAFSFCQDKIMTTGGEGGMITTNDPQIWKTIWAYKDHGKDFDAVYHRAHPIGFRWLHSSFGTNWRMTEVQAAIGRVQLKKLPEWLSIRKRNADILTAAFSKIPFLRVTLPSADIIHAYYKYYVFLKLEKLPSSINRDTILKMITDAGVPCYVGSCSEIYLEDAFVKANLQPKKRLQIAKELGETSLVFLIHPTLTAMQMHETVNKIIRAIERVGMVEEII